MSNIKKTAAAILAVALMGTALPFSGSSSPLSTPLTANAEEQATTASLSNGVITLNGNVKKEDVQQYNNNTSVTMVVCGDNVVLPTNSSGLFRYIKAKEIDLSTADTSGVTDMTSMFYECSNLERLNISGFDTSHVTSMSQMFSNCPKLKDVDLNGFDTSNVKRMDWMFNSCKSLSFIDITGFKTNKVENMDYMFAGCSGITSIDLSSLDTSNVKSMINMFDRCTGLTSLDVSTFNTSSVTNMFGMFIGCTGLTSLDVSSFDTSKVTNMTHMFSKCSNLTSLDLSNLDTSNVTRMAYMFNNCKSLTSLDLSGVKTGEVTNMYQMFNGCSNLTSLELSSFDTSNVTDMRCMFADCSKLTSLDLTSFKTLNVTTMASMFDGCKSLSSVDLSSFNTKNVTDMGLMFDDCALTSLDLSNFDTSSVTDMSSMFRRCTSLKSVDVSSFNTENVENIANMFIACSKLEDVDLTGFDMKKVRAKGSMLGGCDKLKPNIVHAMFNNTTLDGTINLNFHIKSCDNLAKIIISGPNGDITFTDISDYLQDDGMYKLTYPLNADQSYKTVTMAAYDSNGKKLIVCDKEDGLLDHSQADRTLDSYLEELIATSKVASITELAKSLRTYCICADEYFNQTTASYDIPSLSSDDLKIIEDSKMIDETDSCKISLVLNSGTSIRIYYSGKENKATYGKTQLTAKKSKYGKYFEIPNIKADKLNDTYTITIGGKKVSFSALSYVQRVFNMSDADPKLDTICRTLYAYGRAAENYKAEQEV